MKKMIKSLAVLATILTAAAFASCNKAEVEPAPSDKVITITINPPTSEETKIATNDNGSKLSITGWEVGDVVTLCRVYKNAEVWDYPWVKFTCTDPGTNTFECDHLPADIPSVDDFNLALYNCTAMSIGAVDGVVLFHHDNVVSQNLKDVIVMAAVKIDGKFTMKVINNIVKIKNLSPNDIDAAWQVTRNSPASPTYIQDIFYYANVLSPEIGFNNITDTYNDFEHSKFTLKANSDNFLSLCPLNSLSYPTIGLSSVADHNVLGYASGLASLLAFKNLSDISTTGGKLYTAPPILPDGALRGVFSVADDKKVYFSRGNLKASTTDSWSTVTWDFEVNQYDFRHYKGLLYDASVILGSAGTTPENTVGSFYWSQTASTAYAATYSDSSPATTDVLFTNKAGAPSQANPDFTVSGSKGVWRSLTGDEWNYLFTTRTMTNGKPRYTMLVKPGILIGSSSFNGVFLYPDDYNGDVVSNIMSWDDINSAGIVFLPAAGRRDFNSVNSVGESGSIWSATADTEFGSYSIRTFFNDSEISEGSTDRDNGFPLRLVTAAN